MQTYIISRAGFESGQKLAQLTSANSFPFHVHFQHSAPSREISAITKWGCAEVP